jgi:hypothetical protein
MRTAIDHVGAGEARGAEQAKTPARRYADGDVIIFTRPRGAHEVRLFSRAQMQSAALTRLDDRRHLGWWRGWCWWR